MGIIGKEGIVMISFKESSVYVENNLKLRTYPLAIQFFETPEEMLKDVPKIRIWPDLLSFCQYVGIARTAGWTIGVTAKNLSMPDCMFTLGLAPLPEEGYMDGETYEGVWCRTRPEAVKYTQSRPRIPFGKHTAIAISPIASGRLSNPQITLFYGTPAQMNLLLNAAQWESYERFKFYFCGEGSCGDSLAECYINRKIFLTIPCFGERRFGCVQDDELEVAIPPERLLEIENGLKGLKKAGTAAYPITTFGQMSSPLPAISMVYPQLSDYIKAVGRGEFLKRIPRDKKSN
jgi:uncharacterized protein (DUF169 family)